MDSDASIEDTDAFSDSSLEEESHFGTSVAAASKPYHVPFNCYSPSDITAFQNSEINHINGIVGGSLETCATLLRFYGWDKEKLVELYMEDPTKVSLAAGVIVDDSKHPKPTIIKDFCCDICCSEEQGLTSFSLACGHAFCIDCYTQYLTLKIMDEGESRRITCPSSCSLIVGEKCVESLVEAKVFEKYQSLLLRTYVDDNKHIKWCPFPNCEYAIECKHPPLAQCVPTVYCKSNHYFCFGCSLEDHQPAPCNITKLWLKKCADDSETDNWIAANTKECVKCKSIIEKNGGCNHMTCKKCKAEFCWVCLGNWTEHGSQYYSCNRYEEKSGAEARDSQAKSRAALERYLHSAALDKELSLKTEKKMEEMQNNTEFSWIEVQFLKKAVSVLLESRVSIQWTYCFAYYLVRNNATEMFEDNQRDLEMAVEMLSGLLETPIDPSTSAQLKQQILDKTAYVNSRREVLLSDSCAGLVEGRWLFNI